MKTVVVILTFSDDVLLTTWQNWEAIEKSLETKKFIKIWIKIVKVTNIRSVELREANQAELTVLSRNQEKTKQLLSLTNNKNVLAEKN